MLLLLKSISKSLTLPGGKGIFPFFKLNEVQYDKIDTSHSVPGLMANRRRKQPRYGEMTPTNSYKLPLDALGTKGGTW